jgi:hypothetical protein
MFDTVNTAVAVALQLVKLEAVREKPFETSVFTGIVFLTRDVVVAVTVTVLPVTASTDSCAGATVGNPRKADKIPIESLCEAIGHSVW